MSTGCLILFCQYKDLVMNTRANIRVIIFYELCFVRVSEPWSHMFMLSPTQHLIFGLYWPGGFSTVVPNVLA
uniref:Uncharacterized protein n=1 Tax=Rhizophora mucronata TaxID=61149 RepID=A0A2P2QSC0_RHIMU